MYFLSTKNVDSLLSLTASEEVSTFEVTKLQDPLPSSRWRSTTLFPNIVGQFAATQTIDAWGLWYNNGIITDWARLRLATTEANLTAAPVVDVNAYLWPASLGFHRAISFAGTGDVDYGNTLDQTTGSFSVQLRLKRTTTGSAEGVAGKQMNIGVGAGWGFNLNISDILRVRISDGVDETVVDSTVAVSDVIFETFTMVVDRIADELILYRGSVAQGSPGDITAVDSITNVIDLKLAAVNASQGEVDVDEFRFFSKALTAVEVAANFDSELDVVNVPAGLELYCRLNETSGATAIDESGNSNDGTITNGTRSNIAPVASPNDLVHFGYAHQRNEIAIPVPASWFRIDFNSEGNAAGFAQGSSLFLDTRLEPIRGQRPNWEYQPEAQPLHAVRLAGGGLDRSAVSHKRNTAFRLEQLSDDEAWGGLEPLLRERNEVLPVGVVLDEKEMVYPMHHMFYGYLGVEAIVSPHNRKAATATVIEP